MHHHEHHKPAESKSEGHIFLLSHMRANTSLISHLLGSHPQICGYYEMHQDYRSAKDLQQQQHILQSSSDCAEKQPDAWLFDKILHNQYAFMLNNLSEAVPQRNIKILLAIRSPEQSIKSIVNLFRRKQNSHKYGEVSGAARYYLQRVAQLHNFCLNNKAAYYYFDADLIRSTPEETLKRLQNWLELNSPLSDKYAIFSLTGKERAGDSSENMTQGKIITQQNNYADINIPDNLLKQINMETGNFRKQIIEHAIDSIMAP